MEPYIQCGIVPKAALLCRRIPGRLRKGEIVMLEKMQELIADQLSVDADSITEASSFKDDLGADSLDLYELIMALEEEYDVEIPTDDLESIHTVGDVINFLKEKGVE